MKICIFTHTFPRFEGDTAAPFMGELAEAFAATQNEIYVLLPYDQKIDTKLKRPYKLITYRYIFPDSLHRLGFSRTMQGDKKLKIETYFLAPLMFLFGFFALIRIIKKEKIDVVSAHWIIPNGFLIAVVKKITGIPFTVTIPGSDIYLGGKNWLFRSMVGFAASVANTVISDSRHYLSQLTNLGFKPTETVVIRYGVNTEKFESTGKDVNILKKYGLIKDTPTIVAVGRMVEKKGFKYLISAMPKVLSEFPKAKLLMVGDGDQKQELEALAKSLQVENNIIFAGTISYSKLPKYYNLGDVFVMPSVKDERGNIDASPVAMMEAMACGAPVVATGFSGSQDLIKNGETGFLVKEKNSEEIATSIINLLRKKSSIRTKVRKIAVDNFSTSNVVKKYLAIFESIVRR